MNFFRPCMALWKREILRFLRQPSRLVGALATPLLFWLLIGSGFGKSFQDQASGQNYFEFFFPGALSMSVLFTAIFSTMSVIEDRHQGFLQGVLVSPASRAAIVGAKVLGGASLALMQGLLLLLISPLAGVKLTLLMFLSVGLLLFVMALCLTGLGFLFAWKIDSVQGYHGIMNIVLMPMWMLSGSLFPITKDGDKNKCNIDFAKTTFEFIQNKHFCRDFTGICNWLSMESDGSELIGFYRWARF